MTFVKTSVAAVALGLLTLPAYAQNVNANANNLVNVNLQDVIDDIAIELNVTDNQIPVTVQLPITLAAAVCDVNVNVLAKQLRDGATCEATSTSDALIGEVANRM